MNLIWGMWRQHFLLETTYIETLFLPLLNRETPEQRSLSNMSWNSISLKKDKPNSLLRIS
jgi:hypothetical protein